VIEDRGRTEWWLDLRFYPAGLLFYAYGLGALKAGHYDFLFRWLLQPVQRDQRESRPFAVRLAHWEGETHDRLENTLGRGTAQNAFERPFAYDHRAVDR
jgi:hypothetical protein